MKIAATGKFPRIPTVFYGCNAYMTEKNESVVQHYDQADLYVMFESNNILELQTM